MKPKGVKICCSSNRKQIQMPTLNSVEKIRDGACYALVDDQSIASSHFLCASEPAGGVPWPEIFGHVYKSNKGTNTYIVFYSL